MKRVLITGITGFVGQHLVRALSSSKCEIVGTYSSPLDSPSQGMADLVQLDIRNAAKLEALIRVTRPHWIYHLAAQSIPKRSWEDPAYTLAVNVSGTLNLLEAVRKWTPKTRVLFASTNLVYGHTFRAEHRSLRERDLLWPENPYAMSKMLGECVCQNFISLYHLDIVIARSFNHFGRGLSAQLVLSDWCQQVALAEAGKQPPVLRVGNLRVKRDFLHVEDVLSAYRLLMQKGKPGEVYNVCTGKSRALRDYAQKLVRSAKIKIAIQVDPSRLRKDDPLDIRGDYSKLRGLGWEPRKTAFDALEELLESWRQCL